jgi:hypothetical protein
MLIPTPASSPDEVPLLGKIHLFLALGAAKFLAETCFPQVCA